MGTCQEVLVSGATAAGQALPALQQLCVDPALAKTLVAGQTHKHPPNSYGNKIAIYFESIIYVNRWTFTLWAVRQY